MSENYKRQYIISKLIELGVEESEIKYLMLKELEEKLTQELLKQGVWK